MSKIMPLGIYLGARPNCKICEWIFQKEYHDLKGNLLAVFDECTLGKLPNLELCNVFYLKEKE